MYVTLPPTTLFYRVIAPGLPWRHVLAGSGAYFGRKYGGRYNRSRQKTVYTSTDPLVVLTEFAFYEALRWQTAVSITALLNQNALMPFSTRPKQRPRLWCFRLTPPPTIIDVTDPVALQVFGHAPHVLLNPSSEYYAPTQDLMDAVFHYCPNPQGPRAQGVQAPSVRTPRVGDYQPVQQVFVLLHNQTRLPGTPVVSWDMDVEFLDAATQGPVTPATAVVEWGRPRFRLSPRGTAGPVAAFTPRPGAVAYSVNTWHRLEIHYA